MATQVVQAVVITATISLILAVILFYFVYRFIIARRLKKRELDSSFRREAITVPRIEFRQHGRALKGVIVDEEGLDVLYLRKLEDGHFSGCFSKVWYNPMGEEVKKMNSRGEKPSVSEPIQEIPLLREPIRAYQDDQPIKPLPVIPNPLPTKSEYVAPKMASENIHKLPPPPLPRISRIPPSPPPTPLLHSPPPPPPPPPPPLPPPPPPPPPPLPKKGNTKPAAPTGPLKSKLNKGLISSHKPPIPPRSIVNKHSSRGETTSGVEMKLKPLHWDKVSANVDHSMVWNEINDGSFRFDDELIESLFGYTTTTQKTTDKRSNKSSIQGGSISVPSAQVFLLDPRKSQNTAIVLKSLAISRKEILDSLLEGKGLNTDILEKLTKICPTEDEITNILQYNDNPTKLAYAESFLYHILKSVPSAFFRFNAMLFKTTYDSDILHLKESLQTLELGCKELRSGGVFYKLLEAILKAGNRMNAGTSRGNAQGFNLSALRRLSDVKSTDGKTTLLHFVVEQVIRSEGKRRSTNQETDREYLRQGLPIIESLSSEFANVKKAATIDYDNFINMSSVLTTKVEEIKRLLTKGRDESGGFVKEMKGFLEDCEEELRVVREEEIRVMEHVRRTTVYYQAGVCREKGVNQIQLFIVVKDFLNMVDQVCVEIGKKYLDKRKVVSESCSSPPLSPTPPRSPMQFHKLQSYFKAQNPGTSSSDSEDDFL